MKSSAFSFNAPTPDGSLANARTATFLSETLDVPLICDASIKEHTDLDVLFLVAGVFLYCRCLEDIAPAIINAKHVVWVQNDYTIMPPKAIGDAESPFRKAFRIRHMEGRPPTDFWTTMREYAGLTPTGAYLNWNSMAYDPMDDKEFEESWERRRKLEPSVLYFGADRTGRQEYFDRYFIDQEASMTISSFSKSMTRYNGCADVIRMFPRSVFNECMREFQLGLYLEDKKSHKIFTSPATRFYEMLGNGLGMAFQPESAPMLLNAGFDVGPYIALPDQLNRALGRAEETAREQRALWGGTNYPERLKMAVRNEYIRLQEAIDAGK